MIEASDIQELAPPGKGGAAPNVRLGQARQAQNLSTADVARRLKLSVWQVEALESGEYHQLPGPVFVRGFIRNYARLLGLEPEELVHAVSGHLPQPGPRPASPPSRDIPFPGAANRRWPRYAAAAAVIVALLAVYEFFFSDRTDTVATQADRVAALPPSQEPRPADPANGSRGAEAKQPAAAAAPSPRIAAPAPAAVAASAQPPRERVPHPEDREVRFVFDEESWVEVRDRNDQTLFAQLNRAGTTRRVSGLPPLSIVVGNAQGVRMTYDGRAIDLARHTKIDVARLKLE
jgi:cytoskeleton protein RodZ